MNKSPNSVKSGGSRFKLANRQFNPSRDRTHGQSQIIDQNDSLQLDRSTHTKISVEYVSGITGVKQLRSGTKATRNDDSLRKLFMVPENQEDILVGEYGEIVPPSSGYPSPFSANPRIMDSRPQSDVPTLRGLKYSLVTQLKPINMRDSIMTIKPPVRNPTPVSPKQASDSIPSIESNPDHDIDEGTSGRTTEVQPARFSHSVTINTMRNSNIRFVSKPAATKICPKREVLKIENNELSKLKPGTKIQGIKTFQSPLDSSDNRISEPTDSFLIQDQTQMASPQILEEPDNLKLMEFSADKNTNQPCSTPNDYLANFGPEHDE